MLWKWRADFQHVHFSRFFFFLNRCLFCLLAFISVFFIINTFFSGRTSWMVVFVVLSVRQGVWFTRSPPLLVVKGSSLIGLMKLSSCSALLYAVVRTLKHDSLIMDTHCGVCVCVCVCAAHACLRVCVRALFSMRVHERALDLWTSPKPARAALS